MLELTPRQRECLLLRSRGLSNKQASRVMGCSDKTVEHYYRVMLKNNPDLTAWSLLAEFVREQCQQGVWE